MHHKLTVNDVVKQSMAYRGTGGISFENRVYGFQPAFLDRESGDIHISCDSTGTPSNFHCFEGVPSSWVLERDSAGQPCAVKASVMVGFVRDGYFFTREQVAQLVQWELDKLASCA